jgi:type II secretory pathway pseudopilin PulG
MSTFPNITFADAKRERRQGELGFTMVEIAIAIGVIGFALVAIIGILPSGMNVQRDSREDNVVSQDAAYFIDAIRSGIYATNGNDLANLGHGLDFLTNSIVAIVGYQSSNGITSQQWPEAIVNDGTISGAQNLGLLATPQALNDGTNFFTFTRVIVRALSSPASAQGTNSSVTAFMYQMDVEITPFNNFAVDATNFDAYSALDDPNDYNLRSNRWMETFRAPSPSFLNGIPGRGALTYSLFDVRLHFSWPVINNGTKDNVIGYVVVGQGRQTYRTVIASQMVQAGNVPDGPGTQPCWFFQPQLYANAIPPGL